MGTLALIGICGLAGVLLSDVSAGFVPAVAGEIAAGAAIGKTGLGLLDADSTTLVFLSEVGFAMLMFSAGMSVPLSDRRLRESLSTGAIAAALVGALAIPAAVLITLIPGVDHPAIYAVLIASGSAAVVVPIIDERRLEGEGVLALIAQVTVADIAATVAIPFVLRPDRALHTVIGTAATAGCVFAVFIVSRLLRARPSVQALRKQGKRRHWAIDLRVALIALFALAWVAERTGTSILIAGFGAGLMVAAIGGPKRLSHEVLGIAGGFFIPLFFVTLGARLQLRGVVEHPAILLLTILLVAFTVVVHAAASLLTGRPLANGLLASAQLGVPSALAALGLSEHVLTATQAAAIVTAAIVTVLISGAGAALLARPTVTADRRSDPAAPTSAAPHTP